MFQTMSVLRSWCCFFLVFVCPVKSALPPSLRYPLPISTNQIVDVQTKCDLRSFNATVTLQHPFKGLIFAKDFSHECNALGTLSNSVFINLPTSGCGIRLTSRIDSNGKTKMVYNLVLVTQQDRYLRQITDQEKHVECLVEESIFNIKSNSLATILKTDPLIKQNKNQRNGRMKKEDENDDDSYNNLELALSQSRAWMEITAENIPAKSLNTDTLQVGEIAVLTFKSTLPAGIGWKVVECAAHDGLGDASQKLLDEDGCPIDEALLPIPEMGSVHPISFMNHQEATARFAAFKFPDRDRLHLSCYLELCRGFCVDVDCFNKNHTLNNRLGRTLSREGEVVDRLKVFNSVEVVAPAIDDLRITEKAEFSESADNLFVNIPTNKGFCVSPKKIAITFCILGVIFLCAVIVAALALLKSRANASEGPFYTRSLFSSSSSGSAYGSKLLLQETPCAGHSMSRQTSYGRIL